jgi:hypothetical protein
MPGTKCSGAMIEGNFQDNCKDGCLFQGSNSLSYGMYSGRMRFSIFLAKCWIGVKRIFIVRLIA